MAAVLTDVSQTRLVHEAQAEQALVGGVANAGAVVRVGEHVLRPSNPHSRSVHRYLRALRDAGFTGASDPVGIDADGRERLVFIDGEVAISPFPAWVQTDAALASLARLMQALHAAAASFVPDPADTWSDEIADPAGGPVVGHNDVCLENVVFRGGVAVGLLDFDFAAPGRPVWDLAAMARMCVPVDDEVNATRQGWAPADKPARLRLVADAYGLDVAGRAELLDVLGEVMAAGGAFVRRRVEAGEQPFIEMWERMGGQERFDRRGRWWDAERPSFEAALR